jgi:hypothetical protein
MMIIQLAMVCRPYLSFTVEIKKEINPNIIAKTVSNDIDKYMLRVQKIIETKLLGINLTQPDPKRSQIRSKQIR